MTRPLGILACLLTVLLAACSKPEYPDERAGFQSVDGDGWPYGEELEFNPSLEFEENTGTARMAVAVRHTNGYIYSNLWLELATPVADSDSMRLDTINIKLADIYGKWLGRGVGVSYVKTDTLPGRFNYDDDRPAHIRHIMRADTVRDIEQIGLIYFDAQPINKL